MSGLGAALSVLMVGHSLFAFEGPDTLQSALRAGMGEGAVQAQIINGAPLKYNWQESHTAQGVDARAILPEGNITHLILTEAIPLRNHTEWSDSGFYAKAFARLAFAANPDARIYLQETWHSLKSGTGQTIEFDAGADVPWRERLDEDLAIWHGVLAELRAGYPDRADQIGLIPAGQAMARLNDEIKAGRIDGLPDITALFEDDIHLSDMGHYFVAMVQYATLTGHDPTGLPSDFTTRGRSDLDLPAEDLARALQRVAWDAVRAYEGVAKASVAPAPPAERAFADSASPPRAPPSKPLADVIETPQDALPGSGHVAIGLASVEDWSTQQPFLDMMKAARPWIGHKAGQWGGVDIEGLRADGVLDAAGWPLRMPRNLGSIGTVILTDLPPEAQSLAGRYVLRYEGTGVIEVTGRGKNVRYAKGEVRFDYTPGPGSVDIRIQRINTSDPPRITSILREDAVEAYDRGQRFNPAWLTILGDFRALRFMDWMETNDSTLSAWEDRPRPGDVSYTSGVPIEVMIDLANTLEKDPWFNVPHLADDAFVREFASMVKKRLDPRLTAYVEFSNEVWNWQFTQAVWADEMAMARWGERDKWVQYYGLRAAEVARIWSEVFGDEAKTRLVNVVSTQTGWLGLEHEILKAPLVTNEGIAAPHTAFDAYAVTGYFGGVLGTQERAGMVKDWIAASLTKAEEDAAARGLSGQAAKDHVARHRYDAATAWALREVQDGALSGNPTDTLSDLLGRILPYQAAVARAHDLDFIMYEGGTHIVGHGALVDDEDLTAFFVHLNYTEEMGRLYEILLKGWKANGGQLFNAFVDVAMPSKWGSWGALRHLGDSNPRWDALVNFE